MAVQLREENLAVKLDFACPRKPGHRGRTHDVGLEELVRVSCVCVCFVRLGVEQGISQCPSFPTVLFTASSKSCTVVSRRFEPSSSRSTSLDPPVSLTTTPTYVGVDGLCLQLQYLLHLPRRRM